MHKMKYILLLAFPFIILSCTDNIQGPETPEAEALKKRSEFTKFYFDHAETESRIPYHFFEPEQASSAPNDSFPLVVALHGIEYFVSTEEEFLIEDSSAYYALGWVEDDIQAEYPAFVVAPNIYEDLWFEGNFEGEWVSDNAVDFMNQLISHLLNEYPGINSDKIFVTGHSAGGVGAWYQGTQLDHNIAAVIPLSSAFSSDSPDFHLFEQAANNGEFTNLPVWAFIHRIDADGNSSSNGRHGDRTLFDTFTTRCYFPVFTHGFEDTIYDLSEAEIKAEIDAGKKHFYTEYDYPCSTDNCHFASTRALKEPLLFEWLFQQSSAGRE
ncbi:MAG: hypothetical protein AAFW89_08120 [Bacteroidota bacterium]